MRCCVAITALALSAAACTAEQELPGPYTAPPDCSLSDTATAIHEAAALSNMQHSAVPEDWLLSYRNLAGPALVDGPQIFPALADLIEDADHDVNIAMFVWTDSDAADVVYDGIRRLEARLESEGARDEPVEVRLMAAAFLPLDEEGIAAPMVEAISGLDLDERLVRVQVATRAHVAYGNMHEKLAIIDGLHVHIGGANVQPFHDWLEGGIPWRDSAYLLSGAVAQSSLFVYEKLWEQARAWNCDGSSCSSVSAQPFDRIVPPTIEGTCTPMIVLNRAPRGEPNNDIDNAQDAGYLAAIDSAKSEIKIFTPNLNDDAAKEAILGALQRGVSMKVILSKGFNAEFSSTNGGTNADSAFELFADAQLLLGVEAACQRLDIRWYARDVDGVATVVDDGECSEAPEGYCMGGHAPGASHTKYMSIDGAVALVGSMNQDTQSWNFAGETNIAIDSVSATAQYDQAVFDSAFQIAAPIDTGHCTTAR